MVKGAEIPFIKMHGAGNDFVFLERAKVKGPITKKLSRLLLDRHFGVGGDQLLVLEPPKKSKNAALRIFNADGSAAEMCGNGVRAVAHYLIKTKNFPKDFVIETKAGPIGIHGERGRIQVDMGRPILEGSKIPAQSQGPVVDHPLSVDSYTLRVHAVSMGNPHCVIFVDRLDSFPVERVGPLIERHPFFPRRVNVEFVQILNPSHVRARVWERGAGLTLACGTGACAILVASARFGKTGRQANIDLPGGQLRAHWAPNDHVYLSGPSEIVFEGRFRVR